MYFIEDISAAVKSIQKMLKINQTGEYDTLTRSRVIEHQENNSINATGIVDYETFISIHAAYRYEIIKENAKTSILENPSFPYKLGDFDENVEKINILINDIFEDYLLESPIPTGKYFGKDTENAILRLHSIFALESTPYLDEILFDRIIKEHKRILRK